jgi:NADH:ubiquinone oxidoreductase subunit
LILGSFTAGGLLLATGAERAFPSVSGRNLHGDDVNFPNVCAQGKDNVVIVAFFQEQQPLVDTCLPQLAELSSSRQSVRYYELPTIKKMNRLWRWTIYKGMRSGIKDPGARSRTVTLHIDKAPFKAQLGIKTEQDIFVFLLDQQGRVKWQAKGAFSESKMQQLKNNLSQTQS